MFPNASLRTSIVLFGCLCLLATRQAAHADDFSGSPPVTRLVPDIEVYPQNFALAQGADSLIYVGNTNGVLIHDGERWRLVQLPNGDIVRSLARGEAGRIYVGGYDQFGWLERNAAGQSEFHDLTAAFAQLLDGESFADIWDIEVAADGVFFRALRHLFFYSPATETIRLWRHEGRFGDTAQYKGDVVVQFRGEGLRRFVGADAGWEPLPGSEPLQQLAEELVNLPSGGLLTLATNGQWRVYDNGVVHEFPMPDGFPDSSRFTRGLVAADGTLVLTSFDGAVYFVDPRAGSYHRLPLATGFLSGLVLAVDGGLLLISDEAVFHIGWPPEWTVLGREHGLTGTLYATARWGERRFALTGAGVQELLAAGQGGGARFARLDWTDHEAWNLLPLDADTALLAESYALKLIRADRASSLTPRNFYPRILQRSEHDPDVVYVGGELGLGVVRRDSNAWRLHFVHEDDAAPGIRSLAQTGPQELWAGSERGGVMRFRFSADHARIESLERFGPEQGIQYGRLQGSMVVRLPDGRLLASTAQGFFEWRDDRFHAVDLDGLDAFRGEDELLYIAVDPQGALWAFSYNHIFRRSGDAPWRAANIKAQLRGAINSIAFDAGGSAVFSAGGSILQHTDRPALTTNTGAQVRLRSVESIDADGRVTPLPLRTPAPLVFDAGDINIRFRFALPDYTMPDSVRYSARLVGLEDRMSDWSSSSGFTYYRMRPGDYRLELRARDSHGRTSEIEPYLFRVQPAWYAGTWAKLAWLALGLILTGALFQLFAQRRTRRLATEKLRLEDMVAERTRELESANRQLHAAAHLDGLTEIANRRRLDEYLAQVWRQCAEHGRPLSLLVIDVDHFKRYNDNNGHLAGDRLLQKLARTLSHSLRRAEDLVARYGGEEFLVVLPGAERAAADDLAETMRQKIETSSLGATISIGVVSGQPVPGGSVLELVNRADEALYRAKAEGRNRVRGAEPA